MKPAAGKTTNPGAAPFRPWPKAWARVLVAVVIFLLFPASYSLSLAAEDTKGAAIRLGDGQELFRYGKSYALLVGVSRYRHWSSLDQIPRELDRVEEMLTAQGFAITRVDDPDSDRLRAAFRRFVNDHGLDPENRLLFFFSGHGHTRDNGNKGYLVPVDAPNPNRDEKGFVRKAFAMVDVLALARRIESRHAIFLFDSCFSGTVFKQKALPRQKTAITRSMAGKVRQFITAGAAGEEVPARSTFTPAFVDAIAEGKADLYPDGYVTGTELGFYLQSEVPRYVRQSPQFGKIRDYELSRGDFVFVSARKRGDGASVRIDPPVAEASALEIAFWNSIKESNDPDEYRIFLKKFPRGAFAELAEARMKKFGVERPPQPASATLIVRSNVTGDTVFLDDRPAGPTSPEPHRLAPGEHTVRVEKEGFLPFETRITLTAGGKETLRAHLAEVPAAIPSGALADHPTPPPSSRPGLAGPGARDGKKAPGETFRDRLKDGSLGPEMVAIPAGQFLMGSREDEKDREDDEGPQRRVSVARFALGATEVTFEEYDRFAQATGRELPNDRGWGRGKRPVIHVSWKDATAYAEWLSGQTGEEYRLPTEAEWEYAARAGTTTPFSTGECIHTDQANYNGTYNYADCGAKTGVYRGKTVPVGSLPTNPWGFHEMHGNVWEWTCSLYKNPYDGNEQRCVAKGVDGRRVVRGGGWFGSPWSLRSANRDRISTDEAFNFIGFRIARAF
uniref:Formylglycine-generating enzyme, required for sulfatase activity, contains SUMF1/FGE domain n=1 Tax=Candidatus Kentrum sp. DK TaxID=2126562 RepID=A0A450RTN6_9GAMM|nr:MAG: Formylglycine-generating enzyme, required for sulfatase activity, contains SUMF1/FGE domain [Candidatus Kentron sp. DK]